MGRYKLCPHNPNTKQEGYSIYIKKKFEAFEAK